MKSRSGKKKVEVTMDLASVLAQLRKERDAIETVISNLERLEQVGRRGPGRPPNLAAKGSSNGANHGRSLLALPANEG